MLKLERLELSGFKSFVDPVTVSFAGGITAIVGPNGCGKSNLSDGMSWVLGEQSAKSLRGGKMEDIIFNGSESRRPSGLAEAHLVLRTDPDFPRSEEGVITIGRRVFRTGESQYRLNGKTVRLKEIKDLLMDTGLGIRAYSVIEQGKIGMILSSKPQERRKLLEEAAGITRYKARKRIAEIKLEEALANLLRLDDIIAEVERALRSLKRQASAARRYQQKQVEYLELLRRVLLLRGRTMRDQYRELVQQLELGISQDAELSAALSRDEASLAAGREAVERQAEALAQGHQRRSDLAATIEGRQEFLRTSRQTLQELDERLTSGRALAKRRGEEGEVAERRLLEVEMRQQVIENERQSAAAAVEADEDQIVSADRLLREAEQRVSNLKREVLNAAAETQGADRKRQQADLEQERLRLEERHLDEELETSAAEVEQTGEAVAIARDGLRQLETTRDRLGTELETVDAALDATISREASTNEERGEVRDALTAARQRREVLEQLARTDEQRRESLAAALDAAGIQAPRYLASLLAGQGTRRTAVDGDWEDALDFYLGRLPDAVVVESSESAVGLARFLSGQVAGGATLLQTPDEDPAASPPFAVAERDAALEADAGALHSLTEVLGLPQELSAALPPAWLAASVEEAERLARQWPGVAFISRDGLWARGGLLHIEGEQSVPGLLARDRELAELGEEIPRRQQQMAQLEERVQQLVATRAEQAKEKNRLSGELTQVRQDLAVAEARLQDLQGRLQRLEDQRRQVEQRRDQLEKKRGTLEQRRSDLASELEQAQQRQQRVDAALQQAGSEIESARLHREGLRSESAGRRSRLEVLDERLEGVRGESRRLRREVDESQQQVTQWQQEGERLQRRHRELEVSREEAEGTLQQALKDRESADDQVILEQEKLDDLRVDIKTLEERLGDCRDQRDSVRADNEQHRVRQASLESELDHLAHSFQENFAPAPSASPDDSEEAPVAGAEIAASEGPGQEGSAPADSKQAGTPPEGSGGELTVPVSSAAIDDAANLLGESMSAESQDPAFEEGASADLTDLAPTPRQLLEEALAEQDEERAAADALVPANESLPAMEADLSKLKSALDRLGPVNLLAMTEFEEQRERHAFLVEQRADVANSVTSLRQTIREINETSSERFRETFTQVNETFGMVFSRLFRGGEAEMRLMDDEDVLETGIEIVARPPGKRLQNIQLMSGGEKALTAIALLFALFRTKPSPFCILDEVDAPLDDANCLRFVETLQDMAQDTQFLVVTHNKITMEAASTLYGVTMEERGVSKLVSVEMEKIHPEQQGERASA